MQRPIRFGVLCEEMGTREDWFAKVRRVEELGYTTLLLRDHFVAGPFGDQFAPLSALTAAAMITTRLRVGSMVFDNDYRHPVLLGKEVATLDVLSGGRFDFGWAANMSRQGCHSIRQGYVLSVSRRLYISSRASLLMRL